MKLFDITRELFKAPIYPNDPCPKKLCIASISKGFDYNMTLITLGSHTGTHLDAPLHFISSGLDVEAISLDKCIGECRVVAFRTTSDDIPYPLTAEDIIRNTSDGCTRLLFKGNIELTDAAAQEMARCHLDLIGVEALTVGTPYNTAKIHKLLLSSGIIILENLCLDGIALGSYILSAPPLRMSGLDGSPVRAVLIEQSTSLPGYDDKGIHRISLSDIYYFDAVDDKVFMYCENKVYECKKKLYELESLGEGFFRSSKSTVMNINKLVSTKPSLSGRFRAILANNEELEISRQYVPMLKSMLGI